MERICLVEAGKYFLGIDAAAIISSQNAGRYIAEKREENLSLFCLESFFDQKADSQMGSGMIALKIENVTGPQILLVNRVIGQTEVPARFEPIPLLYPELAVKCCPQIFIHGERLFLLLDVHAIASLQEKLKTAYGLLSGDEWIYARKTDEIQKSIPDVEKIAPWVDRGLKEERPREDPEDEDAGIVSQILASPVDDSNSDSGESQPIEDDPEIGAIFSEKGEGGQEVNALGSKSLSHSRNEDNPVLGIDNSLDVVPDDAPFLDGPDSDGDESKAVRAEADFATDAPISQVDVLKDEHLLCDVISDNTEMESSARRSIAENSPHIYSADTFCAESKRAQTMAGIDVETFKKVVSWTIGKYIAHDRDEEVKISANDFPAGLIKRQELSDQALRGIISRTKKKCDKLDDESLRFLKKNPEFEIHCRETHHRWVCRITMPKDRKSLNT